MFLFPAALNLGQFFNKTEKEDGAIPNTVPFESMPGDPNDKGMPAGSSGWGDAAVIIPYKLYEVYGDKSLLADNYEMMQKWVDFEARSAASNAVHMARHPLRNCLEQSGRSTVMTSCTSAADASPSRIRVNQATASIMPAR